MSPFPGVSASPDPCISPSVPGRAASFCPGRRSVEKGQLPGPALTCCLWAGRRIERVQGCPSSLWFSTVSLGGGEGKPNSSVPSLPQETRPAYPQLWGFVLFFIPTGTGLWQGGGMGAQLTPSLWGSHRNSEVSPQKKERKRRVEGRQGTPICPEASHFSRSGEGCVKSWGA